MTEKEKEQKALEIYQQLMHALVDIADKEGVIEIVNTLIDENGLSSPGDGKETVLSAKRGRSDDDEVSLCRSCFATKNAEAYITWEAWKLLNRTKSLAEKKEILKSLSTPGKRTVTVEEIRAKELPEILHQTITT